MAPKVEQLVQAGFALSRAEAVLDEPRKTFEFLFGCRHDFVAEGTA